MDCVASPRPTQSTVLIETFTFLERNANRDAALTWKDSIYKPGTVKMLACDQRNLDQSGEYFRRTDLHKLSAVDATSFVIMKRARIRLAFAFDCHFAVAGFRCREQALGIGTRARELVGVALAGGFFQRDAFLAGFPPGQRARFNRHRLARRIDDGGADARLVFRLLATGSSAAPPPRLTASAITTVVRAVACRLADRACRTLR